MDDIEETLLLLTQPESEEERPTMSVGGRKLMEVYGDHVHEDDRTTHDDGVLEDTAW